jgi:hypothetical protein
MINVKNAAKIIREEVEQVLAEALPTDTRFYYPGERLALKRARQRKGENLTPEERNIIKGMHAPAEELPTTAVAPLEAPPEESLASKVGRQTRDPRDHKTVEAEDVAAFKMYKKLSHDLLEMTEEQRRWMAGHQPGVGVIPRDVLRQEVPEILDAIEKVERNEVDPEVQERLSRYQSAPLSETEEEREARRFQYMRAVREFNAWRDKPYSDLDRWLKTMAGMDFALEYNTFDPGGFEGEDFPGGEEAAKKFKETFNDKIAIEQHLQDKGYNAEQLSYFVRDPEKIY